jgi:hypothetical protein
MRTSSGTQPRARPSVKAKPCAKKPVVCGHEWYDAAATPPTGEYGLSITTRPRAWAAIVTVAVRPGSRMRGILYDPCSP